MSSEVNLADTSSTPKKPDHFLQTLIRQHLEKADAQKLVTRFPPEPNGYLHIGHAKSICLNFGLADEFGGHCNLRFDDTNPVNEDQEYVEAIKTDVKWLGFDWGAEPCFASNYFQQFYDWAQVLVKQGDAYVCELSADQAREYRGTLTDLGTNSPYRDRTVDENLVKLESMRLGEYDEGAAVLRAKIDMAHPNINMRDPILYRIRKQMHQNTGDAWCIYPSYDFAHGQEDVIEGVSHSICTLEFQDHRPLYDWLHDKLAVSPKPKQIEFARLHLNYTITSKRKLKQLVEEGHVESWDDPRMPTLSGMRRRGFSPASIRNFCEMIGVTRSDSVVDVSMLEFALREDLNENAPRALCVLKPLLVNIRNFSSELGDETQTLTLAAHPNKPEMGSRQLPFSSQVFIDQADFSEDITLSRKKFKRLVIGEYIRLRGAYVIQAQEVVKDKTGNIIEILADLVPDTLGNNPPAGIRPRGVIHWVDAEKSMPAQIRLYDRLFTTADPGKESGDYLNDINPDSLEVVEGCRVEKGIELSEPGKTFQFEREGYFCQDSNSTPDALVFNRTIGLKDTWSNKA